MAAIAAMVIGAIAVGVVATKIGSNAGKADAELAKQRLELVWPSFMSMPDGDRALVVGLAMTCNLSRRPADAGQVVACLKSAASDPNATLPKGTDRRAVPARLDALLREKQT
ncbi:hypothetical protein [Burkholderia cenocepacia]|uniref:hypothetical protein n=1 Tax=Burkholderia cenocepacia TaxID=95486 RepID=UPI002652067E|nr:hypothetical protein [Burkholderia cenocepacia]MDN7664070.1 hypothetical protein [Burkholderia cenocepacia]